MKTLLLLGAVVLLASSVTAAFAVPMCNGPRFDEMNADGTPLYSEVDLAAQAEMRLRQGGIDANMTRYWNGCIRTFVRDENGHERMRFFDPDTLAEIPVN